MQMCLLELFLRWAMWPMGLLFKKMWLIYFTCGDVVTERNVSISFTKFSNRDTNWKITRYSLVQRSIFWKAIIISLDTIMAATIILIKHFQGFLDQCNRLLVNALASCTKGFICTLHMEIVLLNLWPKYLWRAQFKTNDYLGLTWSELQTI